MPDLYSAPPAAVAVQSAVSRHCLTVHGQPMSYLETGRRSDRPVVVLVHGLGSNAGTWLDLMALLGPHVHVIAPDLLGHGESGAPRRGDYSVSGHASRLRDLLRALGLPRAAVVGHSFGGGVAMSFVYQFPERAESLVLISSGGLGPELSLALRAACLPGVALTAQSLTTLAPGWIVHLARYGATRMGWAPPLELIRLSRILRSLTDPDARRVFLHTLRGAVSWSGQRLDATDLLYLLAELPTLLIAGRRDRCIPHRHTLLAHQALPGSRLAVLDAGHFPHAEHPEQVTELILDLLASSAVAAPLVAAGAVDPTPAAQGEDRAAS
jgi:pimeloyl-ACP methyl ester carboxylesterase